MNQRRSAYKRLSRFAINLRQLERMAARKPNDSGLRTNVISGKRLLKRLARELREIRPPVWP
jgi:hypothetical protein